METYKLLCTLNRKEQFGEEITEEEKTSAVSVFLNGRNAPEDIVQYKKCMRVNPREDHIYPDYYIPSYSRGKKLRLVQGFLPKTNILYANHYEAEILRLLVKYAPDHDMVKDMADHTLKRFEKTCFGNSCMKGERVTAGISVRRFLAAVEPMDEGRVDRLLQPLGELFLSFGAGQAASQKGIPLTYLLMAFTDINNEKTRNLLLQKRGWLISLLRKGWITGKLSNGKISEGDTYNLLGKYIIRNAICTLPEYAEKEDYRIYVDDADERCYCDIDLKKRKGKDKR